VFVKHVLMVAFHYPPESSSSGVLRTLKFSRYLPEYGWRASVLTINAAAYAATDPSLLRQVPESVRVVRTKFVELRVKVSIAGRYPALVATPDPWIGWYPYAVTAGKALARLDRVDALYSTSPHPTAHLIGSRLAKTLRVPLIMDFRDPWREEPPEPGTPAIINYAARILERRAIAAAAHVVASTTHLRDALAARYPEQPPEKFSAIINGFDESDFAARIQTEKRPTERMVLLHAGNINAEFRDPRPLFEALGQLILDGTLGRDQLEIRFLGAGPYAESEAVQSCIRECRLDSVVNFIPRVSYQESLSQMAEAAILLLLQYSDDTASLVPAKLYEYLRTGRPVLAMTGEGATSDVLRVVGGGWTCNPGNAGALDSVLREILALQESGELSTHVADRDRLQRFDRRVLTGQLAATLNDATCRAAR